MATVTLTPQTYARRSERIALQRNSVRENIVEKSFAIANYYVPYHLRCSVPHKSLWGLPKQYLVPPQNPPELFTFIAKLCTQMENENCSFFNGLPDRVNLNSENAEALFLSVSKETFSDKIVNWGRVVSIYTLAGTFAVHFITKGQLSVVKKIPCWVQEFVDEELADWIEDQGGWVSQFLNGHVHFIQLSLVVYKMK